MNKPVSISILIPTNNDDYDLPTLSKLNIKRQSYLLNNPISPLDYVNLHNIHDYNKIISKLELIKDPITTFLLTIKTLAPLCNVSLVEYSTTAKINNGTIDEQIQNINDMYPSNQTNFKAMTDAVKQIKANIDPSYDVFSFVLTDGKHNVGCPIDDLYNDKSLNGLFNLTLGIGNKFNVEHKLLKYLVGISNNADEKQTISDFCPITTDPGEILELINGGCFEGLNSIGMASVSFEAIYENPHYITSVTQSENQYEMQFVALGIFDKQYMDENDVNSYICNLKTNNYQLIAKHLNNDHIVIQNANLSKSTNLFESKKIHFIIAIDNSASMGEKTYMYDFHNHISDNKTSIHKPDLSDKIDPIIKLDQCNDIEQIVKLKQSKYVKVEFCKIPCMTHTTNIFIKGNLKHLIVKYTDYNKIQHVELINFVSTSEDNNIKHDQNTFNMFNILQTYIDILAKINFINDMIELKSHTQSDIEQKIQNLYINNLNFLHKINLILNQTNTLNLSLINQAKSLWQILTTKYIKITHKYSNTLYDDELQPISSGSIMRAVSDRESSHASNRSTYIRQKTQYAGLCRICFKTYINCMFESCCHAGLCLKCIDKSNLFNLSNESNQSDQFNQSPLKKVKRSDNQCPFCNTISTNIYNISPNINMSCYKCPNVPTYVNLAIESIEAQDGMYGQLYCSECKNQVLTSTSISYDFHQIILL